MAFKVNKIVIFFIVIFLLSGVIFSSTLIDGITNLFKEIAWESKGRAESEKRYAEQEILRRQEKEEIDRASAEHWAMLARQFYGAINVFDNVNIRNNPSLAGRVVRQSAFGDYFNIFEKKGSGKIENGVLDFWYKISDDNEEWINALYLREFPFYIGSKETSHFTEGYYINKLILKVNDCKITDEKIELLIKAFGEDKGPLYRLSPISYEGYIDLQENYSFDPNEYHQQYYNENNLPEFRVSLKGNTFDNFVKYVNEIKEAGEKADQYQDENIILSRNISIYDERGSGYNRYIIIGSEEIQLRGIRIGNTLNDIIAMFGDDYDYYEDSIIYDGSWIEHFTVPNRLEFEMEEGKVVKIRYSRIERK